MIWYLLKCPEGNEANYVERCRGLSNIKGIQDIICFQYQRMLRYSGSWHLENRLLLPGCIFLSKFTGEKANKTIREENVDTEESKKNRKKEAADFRKNIKVSEGLISAIIPCKVSDLKSLCSEDNLIKMSQGIIKNGVPVVTHGPLKGREDLIRKIDRHKRTAEIEIQLAGQTERITVGLEIYKKQI